MGKFNRGGDRGGFGGERRGGFGGGNKGGFQKKSWGSDRGGDRQMFSAVCDECKKNCEVPFRPSGDKPVYCSDCFRKEEGAGAPREQRNSFGGNRDFGRGGDRSFSRGSDKKSFDKPSEQNNGLNKQLADMNSKLDRLISAIEGMNKTKAPVISEKVEKNESPKKVEIKTEVKAKVAKKEVSKKSGGKVNSKKK